MYDYHIWNPDKNQKLDHKVIRLNCKLTKNGIRTKSCMSVTCIFFCGVARRLIRLQNSYSNIYVLSSLNSYLITNYQDYLIQKGFTKPFSHHFSLYFIQVFLVQYFLKTVIIMNFLLTCDHESLDGLVKMNRLFFS